VKYMGYIMQAIEKWGVGIGDFWEQDGDSGGFLRIKIKGGDSLG
jgi:hypothetical protein